MKLVKSMRFPAWFFCTSMALGAVLAAAPSAMAQDTGGEDGFDPKTLCPPVRAIAVSGMFRNPDAEWLFCIPHPAFGMANGVLVAYAHGTVEVIEAEGSIEAITDELEGELGGASTPGLLTQLGFSFGVVARSKTGLSVPEGIDETKRLVDLYREEIFPKYFCQRSNGCPPPPTPPQPLAYVIGASQGGLIATLLNEGDEDESFTGTMTICAPHGKFRAQFRYLFNYAVLFDYFFRDQFAQPLLTKRGGQPHVPQRIIDNWETGANYKQRISNVISSPAQIDALSQAMRCAGVPSEEGNQVDVAMQLAEKSFLRINDGVETLGGNPTGNWNRIYSCSDNPFRLNFGVKRFRTDPAAVDMLNTFYETTGALRTPEVALHNVVDPGVPFWHEMIYWWKTVLSQSDELFTATALPRFGHCKVEPKEAVLAFAELIQKTLGSKSPANE